MPQDEGVPAKQVHALALLVGLVQQGSRPARSHTHKSAHARHMMLTLLASSPIWLNAGMTNFPTADTHGLSEGHSIHQVGLKPPHVWSSKAASFCHAMQTYLQVQAEADMLCVSAPSVLPL